MLKKIAAASIAVALLGTSLGSGAIAATRPGQALPSLTPAEGSRPILLAQNDTPNGQNASGTTTLPDDGRAEPKKKKKRRFFGFPLWGIGSLIAGTGGIAAFSNGGPVSPGP